MKSFIILPFSIDFSTSFLRFSLASWGSASRTPYKSIFQNFLKLSLIFRENYDKILTNFLKIPKFNVKFQKIIKFSLIFYLFLKIFDFEKNAKFLSSTMKKYPLPSSRDPTPNGKSCINYCLYILAVENLVFY